MTALIERLRRFIIDRRLHRSELTTYRFNRWYHKQALR